MNRFEHFHEMRPDLLILLGGIVETVASPALFEQDSAGQRRVLAELIHRYPFLNLAYLLNAQGIQTGDNVAARRLSRERGGAGTDRRHRPYYRLACEAHAPILTDPYLSITNGLLCITIAAPVRMEDGQLVGMVVADCELERALALLEEDDTRRSIEPAFKFFYLLFSVGLLLVSVSLAMRGFLAVHDIWRMARPLQDFDAPFQATIFFTLALAVFDLAKTIFEEEVLLRKDIRRHSSTRRTLTRFIAAISIAVSIEGLMLVFKFALNAPGELWLAVLILAAAAGLVVALGLYVYLGVRAEILLLDHRQRSSGHLLYQNRFPGQAAGQD